MLKANTEQSGSSINILPRTNTGFAGGLLSNQQSPGSAKALPGLCLAMGPMARPFRGTPQPPMGWRQKTRMDFFHAGFRGVQYRQNTEYGYVRKV